MATTEQQSAPKASSLRDLGPRLVSGLVLALAALALTWFSLATFALLVLAVALIVAWEWGRMVRGPTRDALFYVHIASTAAALVLTYLQQPLLAVLIVAAASGLVLVVEPGDGAREFALGVLYSGAPAVALVWLRASEPYGLQVVMFILLVIWATDTGAYAAGRTIGGPRLMPRVSPNKTWSGLAGGVGSAVLVALIFELSVRGTASVRLPVTAALLAVVSQAGDLLESALKRRHAVKDASELIPGHGGFMDRVDGLIFAAVTAALYSAAAGPGSPAGTLLGWYLP